MKTQRVTPVILAAAALLCASCTSSIVPVSVVPSRASFDGNEPDSGVIGVLRDEEGRPCGWIVTSRARARYNAFLARFGDMWSPPVTFDHGVTPLDGERYLLDNEAMEKFVVMSLRAASGE